MVSLIAACGSVGSGPHTRQVTSETFAASDASLRLDAALDHDASVFLDDAPANATPLLIAADARPSTTRSRCEDRPSTLIDLPVPGHGAAVVSAPSEATGRLPVVVAAHGNFDRPEWQCRVWQRLVEGRAFVLCPRGVARDDAPRRDPRFTYSNGRALLREIDAGVAALRARFGDTVDTGPVIFSGFSLGAILGVAYVRVGRPVSIAVMIEGAAEQWTERMIHDFAAGGGRGVLFACGQSDCAREGRRGATRLRRAGIAAGVAYGRNAGHLYWGPVLSAMQRAFPAMGDADPRLRCESSRRSPQAVDESP